MTYRQEDLRVLPEIGDKVDCIMPMVGLPVERKRKIGKVIYTNPLGWYLCEFKGYMATYKIGYRIGGSSCAQYGNTGPRWTYFKRVTKEETTG